MIDRKIKSAFIVIAIFIVSVAAIFGWLENINLPTGKEDAFILEIAPGMTAGDIAHMLHDKGIIRNVLYFNLVSEMLGYSKNFKAGRHVLSGVKSVHESARLFTQIPPSPPDIKVTIFEGLNIKETSSILASVTGIDSSDFVKLAVDKNVAIELGVDNDTLEGYLYPDTYFVRHDTKPIEVITRMIDRFNSVFNDSLKKRASELGMSINEVVALASIIETEAQLEEERPIISAVFHRRLQLGRPLEANPTIQYALGNRRRVLKEDLDIDSPYNTYTNPGLPPGPIASPGKKSLIAALYPADTKYLYFMANGKGGHVFSKSLNEHNRAARQYKRMRKQLIKK